MGSQLLKQNASFSCKFSISATFIKASLKGDCKGDDQEIYNSP